jgi:hypothetical protein
MCQSRVGQTDLETLTVDVMDLNSIMANRQATDKDKTGANNRCRCHRFISTDVRSGRRLTLERIVWVGSWQGFGIGFDGRLVDERTGDFDS